MLKQKQSLHPGIARRIMSGIFYLGAFNALVLLGQKGADIC